MGELVPAQAGRAAGPRRQAMTATALRGLSRFADARGVPPGGEFLLDYDVIEAFCVTGLAGRASLDPGHVPVGAVPARRSGARAAGAAGDAVPGREGAGAVLAGGAGRAGRARSRAARPGETRPRRWRWWCSASARGCGPASWWRCAAMTSPGTAAR